jgi:hypothetical protein
MVWDGQDKPSAWSEPAFWSMGLLKPEDWKGQWISDENALAKLERGKSVVNKMPDGKEVPRTSPWLRKTFTLAKKPKRAIATIASVGWHELHVNGVFFDEDGSVYGMSGPCGMWRMTDDMKGIDREWPALDGTLFGDRESRPLGNSGFLEEGFYVGRDCGYSLFKTEGRYVHNSLCLNFGYDGIAAYSEGDIRGPYKFLGIVPGMGNTDLARNSDGKWYVIPQAGGSTDLYAHPFRDGNLAYCFEMVFDWKSKEPTLFPAHDIGHLDEAVYRK